MMKHGFFTYLKSYSCDPQSVNRLIVSNFLYSNNIQKCNNVLIEQLRIKKDDSNFDDLKKFVSTFSIITIEDLIEAFEYVISPEEKVITGAIYTPNDIREFIVDQVINIKGNIDASFKLCDPACGCSGFLYTAAKMIKEKSKRSYFDIYRENLFGLDIQKFSITRSELLLSLAAIVDGEDPEYFSFNLHLGNALNFDWKNEIPDFIGFDSIVGNPPYVCSRNIDRESKILIQNWSVSSTGHPDLYIPFFELGISFLKPNATLGYITMNTFFKSVNGRALRDYFQTHMFDMKIIDFGSFQVFDSKSTYTCICVIQKSVSENLKYVKLSSTDFLVNEKLSFKSIGYKNLDFERGWNLQEREILNKIESIGTPLGKKFTSRNGIATLKNDVYIFDPFQEDEDFYFLQNDREYQIERAACVDIINPNKLTKLDSIESIRKKIIFPYRILNGQAVIIPEEEFKMEAPGAYKYLLSKKEVLATRDKGKGKDYQIWYAYGRNQSLENYNFKLFFPHISPSIPNYVINNEPSLLFVNGLAIIGENERELKYLRKIMSSRLFWFYIINSSKPYGSGYYSFSRNYIKNFGIYDFSDNEIDQLLAIKDQEEINNYIENLYDVDLTQVKPLTKVSGTTINSKSLPEVVG
ncbi:Eco57I restriction-modification methylase domain-containing protein [Autumnicola musiva]|uniref:site-specific DNA-methyltransferase (adenine-specific) n=1 Tax=Autumnicola musiva TaxID=3075589 RepID=A0ABU3D639_9FLAO|nr:N-6 DNA methylase [Zunongwangia sp. F117]MDT0676994.1 N-6 DNA methylase [Zunongwangia sp. F117]